MTDLSIKYFSFPAFFALFEERHLVLRRIDLFEDLHEGSPDFSTSEGALYYVRGGRLAWVNCWSNYRNGESIAMWDLYAGRDGVAIIMKSTKLQAIARSLVLPSGYHLSECGFDSINYTSHREEGDILSKRRCFRHEEEQRIWVRLEQVGHKTEALRPEPVDILKAPINLLDLEEIIVSPRAPAWLHEALQKMVHRTIPGLSTRRSNLFLSP